MTATIVEPTGVLQRMEISILEALEQAHCRKRRKNNERRNQQRSHEVHRNYDDHRNDDRDKQIVNIGVCARCGGKVLVKGDGEYFVVEQNEHRNNDDRNDYAEVDLAFAEREYRKRAEQSRAHIARNISGLREHIEIHQKIAYRERSYRNHSKRRVALDLGVLACPKQKNSADYCDGHYYKHIV